MFVSPIGRTPIRATSAVRKVTKSTAEEILADAVDASSKSDEDPPQREHPELAQARTPAERSSPDVLDALAALKLGG